MNYNNPENLPVVGEESSHSKLKNEIIEEGREAWPRRDCPYRSGSTFNKWWWEGWNQNDANVLKMELD